MAHENQDLAMIIGIVVGVSACCVALAFSLVAVAWLYAFYIGANILWIELIKPSSSLKLASDSTIDQIKDDRSTQPLDPTEKDEFQAPKTSEDKDEEPIIEACTVPVEEPIVGTPTDSSTSTSQETQSLHFTHLCISYCKFYSKTSTTETFQKCPKDL